jgi:hypothetical protein
MDRWKLDPSLRRILLYTTSQLSVSSETPLTNLADEYLVLLATQQTIGVDALLFGFFSTDWVRLQDRYLRAVGLPQLKHEALQAIRSIITAFHDQWHAVWLLCNAHLHGTDPNNTTSYTHLHLLAQIRELYDAAPHMLAHNRDVLAFPLEAQSSTPMPNLSLSKVSKMPPSLAASSASSTPTSDQLYLLSSSTLYYNDSSPPNPAKPPPPFFSPLVSPREM